LKSLDVSEFDAASDIFMRPYYDDGLELDVDKSFTLPSVLVPPEVIDLEALPSDGESELQLKQEEWPVYLLRLFDDDVGRLLPSLIISHLDTGYSKSSYSTRLCSQIRVDIDRRYI
jgi:hypothetical protein